MFWFGVPQAHIHSHRFHFLSSLFIIMLTVRVSRSRRRRDSLSFHKGLADLIQSCGCLAPHSTLFLYFLAPRNQKISYLWDLLEMWNPWVKSSPQGDCLPWAAGKSEEESWAKMEKETARGRLYSLPSSWGLQSQSCSNIERKSPAKLGLVRQLLAVIVGGLKTVAG